MGNQIKTSDLYTDTGELKRLLAELDEIHKLLVKLKGQEANNAKVLQTKVSKLSSANKGHAKGISIANKQAAEIKRRTDQYTASLSANGKEIAKLKLQQQKLNKTNKNEAKLLAAKKGSYDALSAAYSLNKQQLNAMSEAERKGTKSGRELEKSTDRIYAEMKKLQEATGKYTLTVGDYALVNDKLQGKLGGTIQGVKDVGKSFKVLLANPVVLFLSLIVGALSALGSAFLKSEKGSQFLARATGILSGLMSSLVKISVDVVDGLISAFENPKAAMKDFGKFLLEQVTNRLEGVLLLAGGIGKALYSAITFDFQGVKDSVSEVNSALLQIGTGLDNKGQEELIQALKDAGSEAIATGKKNGELNVQKRETVKLNRELQKSVEQLLTKEQLLNSIADDSTKSFKEQADASIKAREVLDQRYKLEVQIAKNNLDLINREVKIRRQHGEDVESLMDARLSAYQALAATEREYTLSVRDNEKERAQLKQDRLEKDLDILIDGFDNQKTINEKIIADESRTLSERSALLEETKSLSDSSFAAQIETIQKFTGVQINANELIAESDAIVLNDKIRNLGLTGIIEGRILESIRDRKSANQDLYESEKALNTAKEKAQIKELQRLAKIEQANKDFFQGQKQLQIEDFNQKQELEQSKFDLLETSAAQKELFSISAERDRLKKMLELNIDYGSDLTDVEIQTAKNRIEKLNNKIDVGSQGSDKDLFDLLGIDIEGSDKDKVKDSLSGIADNIKSTLTAISDARLEAARIATEAAQTETDAKQGALDAEIALRDQGFANNVATAAKELKEAQKNQKAAEKEQEKAAKNKRRLDTIAQTGSLITAAAGIWKSLAPIPVIGTGLAIAAIGTMFGSFASSKVIAAKLAKKTYGKGDFQVIGGGSHASGNDTYLGTSSSGNPEYAEQGEARIIVPKSKTRKYSAILPNLAKSLIAGDFEHKYSMNHELAHNESNSDNLELGSLASTVQAIADRVQIYTDSDGNLVEVKGNIKTTYVQ